MVNVPSLRELRMFLSSKTRHPHELLSMPAIYKLYTSTHRCDRLIKLLTWIEEAARTTINELYSAVKEPLLTPDNVDDMDHWTKVCYGTARPSTLIYFYIDRLLL